MINGKCKGCIFNHGGDECYHGPKCVNQSEYSEETDRNSVAYPGKILTVIIADKSPLIISQDPPTHRTVHIMLTDDQLEKLKLKWIGYSDGRNLHEGVAMCFIEDDIGLIKRNT